MGMRVRLTPSTARSDGGPTLYGGTPARVLYVLPTRRGCSRTRTRSRS